ncbi:MAG: pyridoxamine 5'-phosphate oxidase family protein [Desulfatibacillaceae bacterium]
MRHKEKEITDLAEIERILAKAVVCRLAMIHGDFPYVVPMCFGYRDMTLYFHTGNKGKKMDAIKSNPNVCFEVDVDAELVPGEPACKWSIAYRSVVGLGRARLLTDEKEKRRAYDVLMAQYTDATEQEYTEQGLAKSTIIAVDVKVVTGRVSDG